MNRVLYISNQDWQYAGETATDIVKQLWERSFYKAENLDDYVKTVAGKHVNKRVLSKELSRLTTVEDRCEYLLKLLTELSRGVVVKKGSKDDKKLSALLSKKLTFIIHNPIYTPPQ